ncbi:MAG: hypothetical protein EXR84_13480 [Gammaproteobacteria bacterium]|nr:hypothetical protein [Gammaproteobacteria bacterium]
MKRIVMLVSLLVGLVLSQTAAADNRSHRRGYSDYGYNSHSRHNSRDYSYRSSRSYGYNPYHYPAYDRGNRRGSSIHISYGNYYNRRHDHDAGYFVGGLVLGSFLSAPRYSAPTVERVIYRSAPVVRTREVVVVNNSAATRAAVASGRRLLRDLEGNCFERVIDAQGNEIRVQLAAEECSF